MFPEHQQKDDGGNGGGSEIRDGLGIEDCRGFLSDQGQDKDQHYIEAFPEKGEREGCLGPLHGGEAVHQHILKA